MKLHRVAKSFLLLVGMAIACPALAQVTLQPFSGPLPYCPTSKDEAMGDVALQVVSNATATAGSGFQVNLPAPLSPTTAPTVPILVTNPMVANVSLTASERTLLVSFSANVNLAQGTVLTITRVRLDASQIPGNQAAVTLTATSGFLFRSPTTLSIGVADPNRCPVTVALSASSLSFRVPQGGVVTAQQVSLTSINGQSFLAPSLLITTSNNGNWLSTSVDGVGSSYVITVSVTPGNLTPGTYTGQISLTVANSTNSPLVIAVSLVVLEPAPEISPTLLQFRTIVGVDPATQQFTVRAGGNVTLGTQIQSPAGGKWLTFSQVAGKDPVTGQDLLTVTVAPKVAGLAPSGATPYIGYVLVTAEQSVSPTGVLVQLRVDQGPQIALDLTQLNFAVPANSTTTVTRTLTISNGAGGTLSWTGQVTTDKGGNWLSISPTSSIDTTAVTATVNPSGLAPGVYTGSIQVTSSTATNSPQRVTVTLAVGTVPLSVSSQAVKYCPTVTDSAVADVILVSTTGGAVPSGASVQITLPAPLAASAAPKLATTPAVANVSLTASVQVITIQFSAAVTLTENTQFQISGLRLDPSKISGSQAMVSLSVPSGSPFTIGTGTAVVANADATVCPPQIAFDRSQLSFSVAANSSAAVSQTLLIKNGGSGTLTWTAVAATDRGGNWLSVNPAGGTGDVVVSVTVNPTGLAPGAYTGTITVTSGGASNSPQRVQVILLVGTVPVIADRGIKQGASFSDGTASAGTILSIFGANLASSTLTAQTLPLPTSLGGAQVKVNGTPAPLFFVSPGQINFQLPPDVTGTSVTIVVSRDGVDGLSVSVPLVSTLPGLFTLSADGKGPGAILKADFSPVSATNPAPRGSVVLLYGSGMGAVNPPVAAGQPAPTSEPLSRMVLTPQVTIGGQQAAVLFAGLAPGFVGLYQINVQVPASVTPGTAVQVVVTISGSISNTVTMAVQ